MKRLTILNEGSNCTAWLAEGDQDGVECSSFTMPADADWQTVLQTLHSKMNLANHSPLGPWTEGGVIAMERLPWQSLQGGFGLPGWGWGFYLPVYEAAEPGPRESCCGFRDRVAAIKAAMVLKVNLDRIHSDLPQGVFEVFALDAAFAFLDVHGVLHATFPSRIEARGCAAKMEAQQMQATNSEAHSNPAT